MKEMRSRQVADLPRIIMAEPLNWSVKYVITVERLNEAGPRCWKLAAVPGNT